MQHRDSEGVRYFKRLALPRVFKTMLYDIHAPSFAVNVAGVGWHCNDVVDIRLRLLGWLR